MYVKINIPFVSGEKERMLFPLRRIAQSLLGPERCSAQWACYTYLLSLTNELIYLIGRLRNICSFASRADIDTVCDSILLDPQHTCITRICLTMQTVQNVKNTKHSAIIATHHYTHKLRYDTLQHCIEQTAIT
jgi:hypothetical protein